MRIKRGLGYWTFNDLFERGQRINSQHVYTRIWVIVAMNHNVHRILGPRKG